MQNSIVTKNVKQVSPTIQLLNFLTFMSQSLQPYSPKYCDGIILKRWSTKSLSFLPQLLNK